MRSKLYLFGVALILASASPDAAEAGQLAGEELRKAFSGKTFQISTPVGLLAVQFEENGSMRGSAGAALASFDGRSSEDRDTGKWQVRGEELCQRWRTWLSGETFCVRVSQNGERFYWRSAEGYSGEARVLR